MVVLVVEGDTLVVTHIDRLSRGLTYGLQGSGPCRRTSTLRRPPASSNSRWCSPSASGGGTRSGTARSPARREYIQVERSKGVSQRELAKLLEISRWTIQQVDR